MAMLVTVVEETDALTLTSFDNSGVDGKSFEELYTTVKIAVYRDENGGEYVERMYVKPDLDYARRKNFRIEDHDFSGRIWYEDLDDNFLVSYYFKDGKLVSKQIPSDATKTNSNARVSDVICETITETVVTTTSYYSITCVERTGTCGPAQFMYNVTNSGTNVLFQSCYEVGKPPLNQPSGASAIPVSDPAFWDWFNLLNQLEKEWLLANTEKAHVAYLNFRWAEIASMIRYGGAILKDQDHTNQNAYKHALAAAYHTLSWGPNVALTIMNNHEGGPNKTDLPTMMDYHNNSLGIKTAQYCERGFSSIPNVIQGKIDSGYGRRIFTGSNTYSNTLIPTTSANLDND